MDIKNVRKATGSNSPTDTTPTSIDGSTRATSLEYDTPGTTPAHSVTATSGKRKRHVPSQVVMKEEDADEELARRLQEEEYGVEAVNGGKSYKRSKLSAYQIPDTDDESELSELESVASGDHASWASSSTPAKGGRSLSTVNRKQSTAGAQRRSSSKKDVEIEDSVSDADSDVPLMHRLERQQAKALPSRSASGNAKISAPTKQKQKLKREALDMDLGMSKWDAPSDPESEYDFGTETSTGVSDTESNVSGVLPTVPRLPARSRPSGRGRGHGRRRFGNLTAGDAALMSEEITSIVERSLMTRKDRERKKLEKSHPGIKTMWKDLQQIPIIEPVAAAQPSSITRTLKSFQLQGLDWMTRQEQTHYRGGLLGDEMGMGKTIQAVSLIMSDFPQKDPTLVVVPPVALMQWSSEITEYTDGKLKVLVYHGQNTKVKAMTVKDVKKYDVIMISYNSLESLYRKQTKGWSRGEDIIKEDSPIHASSVKGARLDD